MADPESYSDEEVAMILRRAADLQPGRSTSLAEIEAVADEAGIDPALVRRAATELRRAEPAALAPSDRALFGRAPFGPTSLVHERSVPGVIDASVHEQLLAEIRRYLPHRGTTERLGDELIWSSKSRRIRVVVTPRSDRTLVRVEERTGGLAGGLFGGLMGGVGLAGLGWVLPICIVVLRMPVLIPVLLAVWVYASYWLARTVYRGVLANRAPALAALADGLEQRIDELVRE